MLTGFGVVSARSHPGEPLRKAQGNEEPSGASGLSDPAPGERSGSSKPLPEQRWLEGRGVCRGVMRCVSRLVAYGEPSHPQRGRFHHQKFPFPDPRNQMISLCEGKYASV